jgi:hypothetical protein
MIEIKISQGAKPGHGGVLPASKNTEEIAKIRGVEPYTKVLSPPGHSTFNDAEVLLFLFKNFVIFLAENPLVSNCVLVTKKSLLISVNKCSKRELNQTYYSGWS